MAKVQTILTHRYMGQVMLVDRGAPLNCRRADFMFNNQRRTLVSVEQVFKTDSVSIEHMWLPWRYIPRVYRLIRICASRRVHWLSGYPTYNRLLYCMLRDYMLTQGQLGQLGPNSIIKDLPLVLIVIIVDQISNDSLC